MQGVLLSTNCVNTQSGFDGSTPTSMWVHQCFGTSLHQDMSISLLFNTSASGHCISTSTSMCVHQWFWTPLHLYISTSLFLNTSTSVQCINTLVHQSSASVQCISALHQYISASEHHLKGVQSIFRCSKSIRELSSLEAGETGKTLGEDNWMINYKDFIEGFVSSYISVMRWPWLFPHFGKNPLGPREIYISKLSF